MTNVAQRRFVELQRTGGVIRDGLGIGDRVEEIKSLQALHFFSIHRMGEEIDVQFTQRILDFVHGNFSIPAIVQVRDQRDSLAHNAA